MKLLVVYAVEEEKVDVPFEKGEVFYLKTGIGKIKATLKTQEAILKIKPDFVLNIGTAGSVKYEVDDVVVCSKFLDRDLIKIEHLDIEPKISFNKDEILKIFANIDLTKDNECSTGDSFVLKVEELNSDVCDMEAFAIARVCDYYKIPFVAVKYVSDKVGKNNMKLWEEKLEDARRALSCFFDKIK